MKVDQKWVFEQFMISLKSDQKRVLEQIESRDY